MIGLETRTRSRRRWSPRSAIISRPVRLLRHTLRQSFRGWRLSFLEIFSTVTHIWPSLTVHRPESMRRARSSLELCQRPCRSNASPNPRAICLTLGSGKTRTPDRARRISVEVSSEKSAGTCASTALGKSASSKLPTVANSRIPLRYRNCGRPQWVKADTRPRGGLLSQRYWRPNRRVPLSIARPPPGAERACG